MAHEEVRKVGSRIMEQGFKTRLFVYILWYIPTMLVVLWFAIMTAEQRIGGFSEATVFFSRLILFGVPTLPFILYEFLIRRYRKKLGLSPWKNISKDLEQIAVNERVAREKKAFETNEMSQGADKKDISYWHGLLKDGAITQDEFNTKKKELL